MGRFLVVLLGLSTAMPVLGASLSTGLVEPEMDRIISVVGAGSVTRLMRTAESYPAWPGVKVGFEVTFIPSQDLKDLGNRDGSVPSLIPIPRFYLSKGLPWDTELIFQMFPSNWSHAIATVGALLKSTMQNEPEDWFALAFFGGYSRFVGFGDQLTGGGLEAGFVASKDYVRIRPFLGLSFLLLHGSFSGAVTAFPDTTRWNPTAHVSAGLEVEMPVNLTFQFDLINWIPSGSFFVGVKF